MFLWNVTADFFLTKYEHGASTIQNEKKKDRNNIRLLVELYFSLCTTHNTIILVVQQ